MKGRIEVQTEALSSLSRQYHSYGQNMYRKYRTATSRLERELESICRKYAEYNSVTSKVHSLQSRLREIERDLREVQEISSKISKGLGTAAQVYKESEREEKWVLQKQGINGHKLSKVMTSNHTNVNIALEEKEAKNFEEEPNEKEIIEEKLLSIIQKINSASISNGGIGSILKKLWENLFSFIEKFGDHTDTIISKTGEIAQPNMADFKKLEYEQVEIDSRYEAYYNKIKALEDIKKRVGDEEVTVWELEKSQLGLIQELLGIPIGDDMMVDTAGMTVNRLDVLKVKADITLEGNGSYLINSQCIEVLIEKVGKDLEKKQQEDIKKEEDYQKLQAEIRELQIQMQKDYSSYLEKARKGEYYKVYLEDVKNGGWGIIYGQEVLNAYGIDKCGEYAVYSRYITHAPEQIKKTAFYKALENLDVSDMTLEEYINTMGPLWELQQKYRTLNDELRDAQIAMAVLSAFTLPMSLAGGAAIATGVDGVSDGVDIAVDLAKGDKVSLGIDVAAVFVPEAIEGLKRVDINSDRVIKNIAEDGIEGTSKLVFKNAGEYFDYINDIGKRTDLTSQQKFNRIQEAYQALEVKGNVTVVSDMKFLRHEGFDAGGRMVIDWPEKMGFAEDSIQSVTRTNELPREWDRVGGMGGENFTTLPSNGASYSYDQRAIPYLENTSARHTGRFNNKIYFDAIDAIKSNDLNKLNKIVTRNGMPEISAINFDDMVADYLDFQARASKNVGNIDATYGLKGVVASWKSSSTGEILLNGGAEQIVTPLSGSQLIDLGVIN